MDRRKLLIADDEPGMRLTVSKMLREDYTVIEAADGEEAVSIARGQKPDLILMDLMMPKLDGYGACLSIKRDPTTREIPVVMLTGIDHNLNRRFAEEMGADGYITKPFTRESLLLELERLMPTAGHSAEQAPQEQTAGEESEHARWFDS